MTYILDAPLIGRLVFSFNAEDDTLTLGSYTNAKYIKGESFLNFINTNNLTICSSGTNLILILLSTE